MKGLARLALLLAMLALLLMLVACGGNATPANTASNPTPTTVTPAAPAPPATPTPPAPTPTPPAPTPTGANPGMFQAFMIQQNGSNSVSGQITINAVADDGSGVLQLNNAAADSPYGLQYCPYPSPLPNAQQNACTSVIDFTTDGSGQANVKFQFPKNGVWAGIFAVVRNSTAEFVSGFNLPGTGKQYRSTLKDASAVNSGTGGTTPGGDGLKHGSVTVNDSTAHVELQNVAPSDVTYSITYCMNGGGSSCFEIGTVSVDSTGSGATDIDLLKMLGTISGSGIFRLNRTFTIPNGTQVSAVEFMTAFVSGCPQVRCE